MTEYCEKHNCNLCFNHRIYTCDVDYTKTVTVKDVSKAIKHALAMLEDDYENKLSTLEEHGYARFFIDSIEECLLRTANAKDE